MTRKVLTAAVLAGAVAGGSPTVAGAYPYPYRHGPTVTARAGVAAVAAPRCYKRWYGRHGQPVRVRVKCPRVR
jgi:hypothetical protein